MSGGEDGFYLNIQNDVLGIGSPIFNNSDDFGSNGELEGYIDLWSLSKRKTDPADPNFGATLKLLAHEVAHRWSAYVNFIDENGQASTDLLDYTDLLDLKGGHWSFLLDSNASSMYGNEWTDNGDHTFTISDTRREYSPLDLYLMGFYGKDEVDPFFLIQNSDILPTRIPQLSDIGLTIPGQKREVMIDDIIAAEGDRLPPASTSKKTFKMAFILLTAPEMEPTEAEILD